MWAEWSEWTECTVSCNGGIHSRDRTCDEAGTCLGIGYQENFCNEMPCPLERKLSNCSCWLNRDIRF